MLSSLLCWSMTTAFTTLLGAAGSADGRLQTLTPPEVRWRALRSGTVKDQGEHIVSSCQLIGVPRGARGE